MSNADLNNAEEPRHPTYGTLDDLLRTIRNDVTDGYLLRIGLHGALSWFSGQYGAIRAEKEMRRDEAA